MFRGIKHCMGPIDPKDNRRIRFRAKFCRKMALQEQDWTPEECENGPVVSKYNFMQ